MPTTIADEDAVRHPYMGAGEHSGQFLLWNGGLAATRTPDLYRVKVAL